MKFQTILKYASTFALAAGLPLGLSSANAADHSLLAQINIDVPGVHIDAHWGDEKKRKLRHAYWLLENANHEYNGYRQAAVDQVKWAAERLGLDLHGEGYGEMEHDGYHGEGHSDEKLRDAKHILEEVAGDSGGREHEHLREAIKDIDRAQQGR